ncbi:MAG: SRPBCC domain-containing protein [Ktedonobacteraceae bacterium]
MDITGNQKVQAPQAQVFSALLNPEVLKNSVPGCESAKLVDMADGQQLKLRITTGIPGFKGPYVVFLQTAEVIPTSRIVFFAEPSSSLGSVKARCAVNIADEGGATNLSYEVHAEMEGKVAAMPEIMLKPAVKKALDEFFKNFEKQVSAVRA